MLGEIIGAVGSIIGGAMGGDTSTKTREKTRTKTRSKTVTRSNLGLMVRQAKKYGFNPLTVLRAGGLGAYGQTQSSGVTKSNSKGKNKTSSSGPLGAAIAGAATSIGNALTSTTTPQAESASLAWNDAGVGAGPSVADDFRNVMNQLAGSNWESGGAPSVGGLPELPASNETYVKKPSMLLRKDYKETPWVESWPADEKEAVKNQRTLPPWMAAEGVEIPRDRLFNIDGATGWAGDDLGQLPMVLYNYGAIAKYNAEKYLSQPRTIYESDGLKIGVKPDTSGQSQWRWPTWDAVPREDPVVESELAPSGVFVPQPSLTDPMYQRRIQSGYY